jgi:hypothetical protein
MYIKFSSETLKERDKFGELDARGKIILEWILGKNGGKLWTRFISLRTETFGWFL